MFTHTHTHTHTHTATPSTPYPIDNWSTTQLCVCVCVCVSVYTQTESYLNQVYKLSRNSKKCTCDLPWIWEDPKGKSHVHFFEFRKNYFDIRVQWSAVSVVVWLFFPGVENLYMILPTGECTFCKKKCFGTNDPCGKKSMYKMWSDSKKKKCPYSVSHCECDCVVKFVYGALFVHCVRWVRVSVC